jgi:DNA-binding MarR family transcriptional regulator
MKESKPEPLSEYDQAQSISYLTRLAHRMFVKVLAIELAPYGVSTAQWSVLRVLWNEQGLSQIDIAKRMNVEKASITSVLVQMERVGLITKGSNTVDRRRVRIMLTPKGRKLRDVLLPLTTKITRIAMRGIGAAGTEQLRQLLTQVVENLESGSEARINGREPVQPSQPRKLRSKVTA